MCCIFWGLVQHLSQSMIPLCSRTTVTSTKGPILWWCQNPYHRPQWQTCLCAGWTNPAGCPPTSLSVLAPNISPNFHSWEDHLSSMFHASAHHKSPCSSLLLIQKAQRYVLTFRFRFPWVRCCRGKHVRIPPAIWWYQIHHRLWFCCDSFSPASSSVLFGIASRVLMQLMLNKYKRWFPFITCEFSAWSVSASWFLMSMYLKWILGSKLILPNKQSRATLWVLETCLTVGLLHFMIILITSSLFSSACWAPWREGCTFEGIK